MTEHILHLRRHLLAREPFFVGKEIPVPGTADWAFVGNGIHPDREAHLHEGEYAKAVEIGETLAVPERVQSVLIAPSPLARAVETAKYMFVGMARAYAQNKLEVADPNTDAGKRILSVRGLPKIAVCPSSFCPGLRESDYKNSQGSYDDGNELVAEAYHKGVNPHFPGYKWMVQKGFEKDPRSERPESVAERALRELVPHLSRHECILAASHQPNLEIITAALTGDLGNDANELWERAGGSYGLGGGFELRVNKDASGKITEAQLRRTSDDPKADQKLLEKELPVNVDVLRRYAVLPPFY